MEFLALCAPFILGILVVLLFGTLYWGKWKILIIGLFVSILINYHFRIFSFSCFFLDEPKCETIKVLSFNCNTSYKKDNYHKNKFNLIALINEYDPDLIFLAEMKTKRKDSVLKVINQRYPYCIIKRNSLGNHIFSKYPLLSDTIYSMKNAAYGISFCSIDYKGRIVDVFGCHLSSNNYDEHMVYMTPDSIVDRYDLKNYFSNVMKASCHREEEARLIVGIIDSIRCSNGARPAIVMGDFNDVCGSPTLEILENAGLKDAWWEGGFGYGATIHNPLPYRIDHIMYNDRLELRNIKRIDASHISDHDALVAEFEVSEFGD